MPAKNTIKSYIARSYYHIYNRGVNKQPIFLEDIDYSTFLSYLKTYLLPKDIDSLQLIISNPASTSREKDRAIKLLRMNNFFGKITLISFCLMPNHFHLLIKQTDDRDIGVFMKSLMTRYTSYFNKKYKRIGPLFQERYKAVIVESEAQLLYLTRYIHRNPLKIGKSLYSQPSSYSVYIGQNRYIWLDTNQILSYFSAQGFNSYQSFVEGIEVGVEENSIQLISSLELD